MSYDVETKYRSLYTLSKILSFIGWVVVALSAIAVGAAIGALESSQLASRFAFTPVLGGGLGGLAVGILLVVQGQLIACFASIEKNTRETAKRLRAFTATRMDRTAEKSQVSETAGSHSST
jgi:hypothetical protein